MANQVVHQQRACVRFPEGRGVPWWTERNRASPIPGIWPYGLEGLREFGPVSAREIPPAGRLRRLVTALAGPRRQIVDECQIGLTWDEGAAVEMVASAPAKRMLSGVIWATDQAGRGSRQVARVRGALRRMDALWVLSRPQADRVREWLGPDSPETHFIRFGIDPSFYHEVTYPDKPLVASIGGDRDRDPTTLIRALEIVHAQRPDVRLVVQTKRLKSAPDGVELLDTIPHVQVRELIAKSTVVALAMKPNWHVSGMTVALEAMSVGRPVVASATPGMTDYVSDDETGLLTTPGDAGMMAERILGLLADPELGRAMGMRGAARVRSGFTSSQMSESLARLIWP